MAHAGDIQRVEVTAWIVGLVHGKTGARCRKKGGPQASFSSSCDSATLTLFLSRDTAHEIHGISFAACAQRCVELFEHRGTLPVVDGPGARLCRLGIKARGLALRAHRLSIQSARDSLCEALLIR